VLSREAAHCSPSLEAWPGFAFSRFWDAPPKLLFLYNFQCMKIEVTLGLGAKQLLPTSVLAWDADFQVTLICAC